RGVEGGLMGKRRFDVEEGADLVAVLDRFAGEFAADGDHGADLGGQEAAPGIDEIGRGDGGRQVVRSREQVRRIWLGAGARGLLELWRAEVGVDETGETPLDRE